MFVFLKILFKSYEIATALENRSHKVRYSDTLESGSIVFSLSGTVYLLIVFTQGFCLFVW
jgi:hypothetical protein